jgi:GNAT superfamily N-acetyltransferase
MNGLRYEILRGAAVDGALEALAALRIAVFREWPYLYDGDPDYERRYMASYRDSRDAILVAARDGDRIVGAATGTPMEDHADEFGAAITARGLALEDIFYCAESVLLPEYRGQGAGHAFFGAREEHARALGRRLSLFCAVVRPETHPLRDPAYRPLEPFWRKRGYEPIEGLMAEYSWRDIGEVEETGKPMQFWGREL